MINDPRCPRCGGLLKIMQVQVPVWTEQQTAQRQLVGAPPMRTLAGYEEKEEAADCPRCTGAY